jgi:hypothetical protein
MSGLSDSVDDMVGLSAICKSYGKGVRRSEILLSFQSMKEFRDDARVLAPALFQRGRLDVSLERLRQTTPDTFLRNE